MAARVLGWRPSWRAVGQTAVIVVVSIASVLARVLVPAMVGAAEFPTDGNRYGLGAR